MSTVLLAVGIGLLLGGLLGALGGGGAILTVPALVYLAGESAQQATATSLVVVGLTAAVGMTSYVAQRHVRWSVGLTFGVVGLPATWVGGSLDHQVDAHVLMLSFAGLMLVAAAALLLESRGRACRPDPEPTAEGSGGVAVLVRPPEARVRVSPAVTVSLALGVGLLTGFFGVGGGFVIVPALVLVLRLPVAEAVGTSLLVVAVNSLSALLTRGAPTDLDWTVTAPLALTAMATAVAGRRLADRLPACLLTRGFVALLVLVAGFTVVRSLLGLAG